MILFNKKVAKLVLAGCLLVLGIGRAVFAKEINFEIIVDRTKVSLNQSLQLNLIFSGTQDLPAISLPEMDGFKSRYLGPSTMMSVVNGSVTSSITHIYHLLPQKIGIFKVGPFQFEYKGDTYMSNILQVEVAQNQSPANIQPDGSGEQETKDISDRIFLVLQVKKKKLYVNEIVPVAIKLYVNRLGVRLPNQFPAAEHEGFSLGQFQQPPKQYKEILGGINYDVVEFNTTLFGLKPGEFKLGPASLECNVMVRKENRRRGFPNIEDFFDSDAFEGLFGGYEAYPVELKSADIAINVSGLPEENKPGNFSGALGSFDFDVTAAPLEVKVGDPVTIKAVVSGEGNFDTVKLPVIDAKDFKIYEPQIKQEENRRVFEQIVMPLKPDIREIPALAFSFFNTATGQYQTITKGPFSLKVTKPEKDEVLNLIEPALAPVVAVDKVETLGSDIVYIKDSPGPLRKKGAHLYLNKLFLLFQVFPLLLYAFLLGHSYWRRRLKTDVRFARQLSAPGKAKAGINKAKKYLADGNIQGFYGQVVQTLQEYLGDRFHLASQGITASIVDDTLSKKDISKDILDKTRELFKECDMARFAASEFSKLNMEKSLRSLEEIIDYLQRNKV